MDQGFSLTEVLVSLILITTTSLALLKQQWQISQLFNQIATRASALSQLDNAVERLHVGIERVNPPAPFKLRYRQSAQIFEELTSNSSRQNNNQNPHVIHVDITWGPLSPLSQGSGRLTRQLVVDLSDE